MESDPIADECKEIFEQHIDSLPFDEAVNAVTGLRKYLKEVQSERDIIQGRGRYVVDTPDTNGLSN